MKKSWKIILCFIFCIMCFSSCRRTKNEAAISTEQIEQEKDSTRSNIKKEEAAHLNESGQNETDYNKKDQSEVEQKNSVQNKAELDKTKQEETKLGEPKISQAEQSGITQNQVIHSEIQENNEVKEEENKDFEPESEKNHDTNMENEEAAENEEVAENKDGVENKEGVGNKEEVVNKEDMTDNEMKEDKEDSVNEQSCSYVIHEEKTVTEEASYIYPQINDVDDKEKQASINQILYDFAIYGSEIATKFSISKPIINYKVIWMSEQLISIDFFCKSSSDSNVMIYEIPYSVNVDIEKGERILFPEIVEPSMELAKLCIGKVELRKYRLVYSLLNTFVSAESESVVDNGQLADIVPTDGVEIFSYLSKDKLGIHIIFEKDCDFVTIEFTPKEIEPFQKEHIVWKEL